MRKNIWVATGLFGFHTLEEAVTGFWHSDFLTLLLSSFFNLSPVVTYWLGQIALYMFLAWLLYTAPLIRSKWPLVILGAILLFEFQHPIAALWSGHYESGLLTGVALALYALVFWVTFYEKNRMKVAQLSKK